MKITIFGASGKVGSLVVAEALRRGYEVVAFVHTHPASDATKGFTRVQGDVHVAADVERALEGSDAVISCLGSWGTPAKDVLTSAMQSIIPAMRKQGITRIITLTGSGANIPGKQAGLFHSILLKNPLMGAGKVFHDGEAHMRLLAESELAWTTLRSPVMTNSGGDTYRLDLRPGLPVATIKRNAVALALLDQLDSSTYIGQAPIIHRAKHNSVVTHASV